MLIAGGYYKHKRIINKLTYCGSDSTFPKLGTSRMTATAKIDFSGSVWTKFSKVRPYSKN